ncbi:hypothetical protein Micbo1qcDRAFT_165428 [Microdochium bolleyi]|uniref:Uncharacterized protein n=1 Tax=Microdochium bolleyi TaxID=196109 RepID=A0A136IX65_9PEZI|nr:hypothetical protein Micbo1qcDRAFT_165428 [Microdochium bolleyi]
MMMKICTELHQKSRRRHGPMLGHYLAAVVTMRQTTTIWMLSWRKKRHKEQARHQYSGMAAVGHLHQHGRPFRTTTTTTWMPSWRRPRRLRHYQ